MARAWLINSRGLARKVRNTHIKDCGANRECPNCRFVIDNSDVVSEWPGLPVGVKFDPSDLEILEHLAAKCGVGNSRPHMFINEFIPTLEGDNGIYYDHPENLPGAKKDGSSVHFFHKTMNAYASGQRKRRKVDPQRSLAAENVRWHKTGKTRAIKINGVQKGCKKIMVLHKSSKKGSKADNLGWVMHQYHLGTDDDEKGGEYVVSKVLYQQRKQSEVNDNELVIEDYDVSELQTSPRTPMPNPPRPGKSVWYDDVPDEDIPHSSTKEAEIVPEACYPPEIGTQFEGNMEQPWLDGESQAYENYHLDCFEDSLLCRENFDISSLSNDPLLTHTSNIDFANNTYGIGDLKNFELDTTPPEFQLASDLEFCSQDSFFDLSRL